MHAVEKSAGPAEGHTCVTPPLTIPETLPLIIIMFGASAVPALSPPAPDTQAHEDARLPEHLRGQNNRTTRAQRKRPVARSAERSNERQDGTKIPSARTV